MSEARSVQGIVGAVARCLGTTLGSGDPIAQLARSIEALGPCLLILDNFEQVSAHAE
ncbi:MAG: hypothetical protein U0527_04210 [Candidatus Eisenbacteria bacterium]